MHPLAKLDRQYVWHPFTQMLDWTRREPILIASGKGAMLRDIHGREFLDANSSIWTNLHGHSNPHLNRAVERQLKKIAHSSALGLANEPASLLARDLISVAKLDAQPRVARSSSGHPGALTKVFFSDDGSTAIEAALKLAYEFTRRTRSTRKPPRFLSLKGAYHGDTVGAVSLGHIDAFQRAYSGLLFKSDTLPAPYCYRCPFNRARPERADARVYRKCRWECVDAADRRFIMQKKRGNPYAGFVFEPLIQGAAGMIAQPRGWLRRVTDIARSSGALLIADEVMTGFGRTGVPDAECGSTGTGTGASRSLISHPNTKVLFACQHESVHPDFLCVAKGLTGGYLPMAATLTTQQVFDAFLGEHEESKTFFHGHSYSGNQLGAASALANLQLLQQRASIASRTRLQSALHGELQKLWALPHVGDIRRVGLIAGIELVRDWRTREAFRATDRAGIRVCDAMAQLGVLTRPVGNVIVLMPPYCTRREQLTRMVEIAYAAIRDTFA